MFLMNRSSLGHRIWESTIVHYNPFLEAHLGFWAARSVSLGVNPLFELQRECLLMFHLIMFILWREPSWVSINEIYSVASLLGFEYSDWSNRRKADRPGSKRSLILSTLRNRCYSFLLSWTCSATRNLPIELESKFKSVRRMLCGSISIRDLQNQANDDLYGVPDKVRIVPPWLYLLKIDDVLYESVVLKLK